MADKDLTVEEMLAAAQASAAGEPASTPEEAPAEAAASAESAVTKPAAAPAEIDPSKMSVAEMLAAAQTGDSAAPEQTPAAAPAEVDPSKMSVAEMLAAAQTGDSAAPAAAPEQTPAAAPAEVDPSKMSVAEMLAAAQAGGSAAPAAAPAASAPAASKPAASAPAKKEEDPVAQTGPRDTASILAAARKPARRGPQLVEDAVKTAKEEKTKPPARRAIELPPAPRREDFMPAKPVPAAAEATDRRGFFASTMGVLFGAPLAVGFTSMAITSLLWLLGLARFMFPNVLTEPPTKFKVGFPDSYAPGQVEAKYKAQFGVWIVRYEYEGEAQIYALQSVCTHLGCTPNWLEGEQKFKCPCHGSGFYKDGINFEGPAPRPLERYAIRLSDDGQLEVDKSAKFNEELGQWADANSYVSV